MLLFCCLTNMAIAQTIIKEEPVYDMKALDVKPSFPDGDEKLQSYLKSGLTLPATDKKAATKVTVLFVVEKNGLLSNIKFVGKADPDTADVLTSKLKEMKWSPGQLGGNTVRVLYPLQIVLN